MRAAGHWRDRLLIDFHDEAAARHPDKVALIDDNSMTGRRTVLSFRHLSRLSKRMALGLHALGVRRSDVVSVQLPNWWQFVALHLACLRIGACTNPVMPIFRSRELSFMLALAETKVFVVPQRFRGFDYPAMADGLRDRLPDLRHVLAVGGEGERSFEAALIDRRWEDELDAEAIFAAGRPGSDEVVELIYTSGTKIG